MGKMCQICRENEATVHLNGIFNEKVINIEMCQECAGKKGVEINPELALFEFINTMTHSGANDEPGSINSAVCRNCGITLTEIKKNGRFGCEKCYTNFASVVTPLLEHIHGTSRHCGKKPAREKKNNPVLLVSGLKKNLEKAVKKENYELAANLRDELNRLKTVK